MKNNKNKLSAVEEFQKGMEIAINQYYHKVLSNRAKRAWKIRKDRLSTRKVAM